MPYTQSARPRVERGGQLLTDVVGRLLVTADDHPYLCHFFDASTKGTVRFELETPEGVLPYSAQYEFDPGSGQSAAWWCGAHRTEFNAYSNCAGAVVGGFTLKLEFARVCDMWNYEGTFRWMVETRRLECVLGCRNLQTRKRR